MTTTANKKIELYARIKKHGEDIKKIFSLPADTDPIKLCKSLRRLESTAEIIQEVHGNGFYELASKQEAALMIKLKALLMPNGTPEEFLKFGIFLNTDPRGYALKIPDDIVKDNAWTIHKDWGGFGIIAPDLNE
tara:strand:- start:579 stop:980 length:402 start_codon:yes stop_codon:yes gene_type:complete